MYVPLSGHVLNHDGGHTQDVSSALRVGDLLVLLGVLLHDFVHLVTDILEDVVQELDSTLTGAHTAHHTEVDVLAAAGQILVAHEFSDLEQLSQVEVLLSGNDVDHLVKLVGLLTLEDGTNITGQVERSAVLADNDGLSKLLGAVLGEVDDDSTFGLLGHADLLHGLVSGGHALLLDLRLSRVDVKVNVQTSIGLSVLLDTELTEPAPESKSLLVTILHALEVTAGVLVLTGINKLGKLLLLLGGVLALLLLGLDLLLELLDGALLLGDNAVDLDVDVEQVVDGVLGQLLLATEHLETIGKQTVLLTPITKVVHLDDVPSHDRVEVGKETTDDGTAQVTSMEGLGDVGRRELDDDPLATLGGVSGVAQTNVAIGTKGRLLLQDTANDVGGETFRPEEELHVRTEGNGGEDEVGLGELLDEFLAQLLGVLLDLKRGDLEITCSISRCHVAQQNPIQLCFYDGRVPATPGHPCPTSSSMRYGRRSSPRPDR